MLETIKSLQGGLEKIRLVPADIGLAVGIASGNIYLEENVSVSPERVVFMITDDGLQYSQRVEVLSAAV
jgi:hypothetical protein